MTNGIPSKSDPRDFVTFETFDQSDEETSRHDLDKKTKTNTNTRTGTMTKTNGRPIIERS